MIDYLSPENITKTDAIIFGGLDPEQVRDAVFRLWLEPNDIWARGILVGYLRYSNVEGESADADSQKAFERETALRSRIMSRIAHGIHRYDRYREPLLIFLTRDVINADADLDETKKRMREEPKIREKKQMAKAHQSDEQKLEEAAYKLGVSSNQLRALLDDIHKNQGKDGSELGIGEIAAKLGINPGRVEAMIYATPLPDEDEPWEETPRSMEEIGCEYGIISSIEGDIDQSRTDLDDSGRKDGSLHIMSAADVRFQDYLIRLGYEKPCGEWVSHASRRRVEIDGKTRIIEVAPPPLQMSEAEICDAKGKLDAFQSNISQYKEMVLEAKGEGICLKEPASPPSMPPLEDFEAWYDQNRTNARDSKQRPMYLFIYEDYFIRGHKHGWKVLNEKYETRYHENTPVSAQKALYRMKNEFVPAFLAKRE